MSTNEVTVLYNDILFRSPDAAGLQNWASALDAGTYTLAQVTNFFATSPEALTVVDPVIRLYEGALHRAPDSAGLTDWVAQADNGTSTQAIAQGFTASAEFIADYGPLSSINPTVFVTSLYQQILGRSPDAAGVAAWLGVLGTTPTVASEAAVVLGFTNSAEYLADNQNSIGTFQTNGANSAEAGTTASMLGTATFPATLVPSTSVAAHYTLTDSIVGGATSATEGSTVLFNLATTNVATGTQLSYTLSGVTASEVVGGMLTGMVTVASNGTASFSESLTGTSGQGLSGNLTAALSVPAGAATTSVLSASVPLTETTGTVPPPSGATFTLTTNVDNFAGGPNDNFIGTYSDGGIGGGNTFQLGDTLAASGSASTNSLIITPTTAVGGGSAATSLVDTIWANVSGIENVSVTTGAGAINIATGTDFNTTFDAAGVNLTATSTGGAITINMSGITFQGLVASVAYTGTAAITAITTGAGAQNIATGSGPATVTATDAAGAQTILGSDLTTVTATDTGSGAQAITSTGAGSVTVHANANGGLQTITTGVGNDIVILNSSASLATINAGIGNDTITLGATHSGVDTIQFGAAALEVIPTPWTAANTNSPTGVDTITNFTGALDILAFSTATLGNRSAVGIAPTNIGIYANTTTALSATNADISGTAGLAALAGHQSIVLVGSNTAGSTVDVYIENSSGTIGNTVTQELAAHQIVLVAHVTITGVPLTSGDFASIA